MTIEIFTRDPVTGLVSINTLANIILTDIKVAPYTAEPNEVVRVSQSAASTITAPLNPEDGTLFGVAVVTHANRNRITLDPNGESWGDTYSDRAFLYLQGPQTLIFQFKDNNWVPVYSANVTDVLNNLDASFIFGGSGAGPEAVVSYDTVQDSSSIRFKVTADCHDIDITNDDTAVFEILASFFRDESSVVTERHVRFQVDDRDVGLRGPNVTLDFSIAGTIITLRVIGQGGKDLTWKIKVEVQEFEEAAS